MRTHTRTHAHAHAPLASPITFILTYVTEFPFRCESRETHPSPPPPSSPGAVMDFYLHYYLSPHSSGPFIHSISTYIYKKLPNQSQPTVIRLSHSIPPFDSHNPCPKLTVLYVTRKKKKFYVLWPARGDKKTRLSAKEGTRDRVGEKIHETQTIRKKVKVRQNRK